MQKFELYFRYFDNDIKQSMPLFLVTGVGGRKETHPVLTLDFDSLDQILNV